ncbi:sugar transferase [Glutamicibacter ardleyensis]|uniref:sugar transferase n=1 Tax=Glutamicibacter ardleyensis TaxID=225894 RepID=UPI003FD0B9AD
MSNAYGTWGTQGLAGPLDATGNLVQKLRNSELAPQYSANVWRKKYTIKLRISDAGVLLLTGLLLVATGAVSGLNQMAVAVLSIIVIAASLALTRTRTSDVIGVGVREYKRVVDACALSAGVVATAVMVLETYDARSVLLWFFPVSLVLLLGSRWLWRRWLLVMNARGYALSQVVVVGNPADIGYVVRQLRKNASPAYKIVGILSEESASVPVLDADVSVFHGLNNLEKVVASSGADAVIVAGALNGGTSTLKDLSWRLELTRTNVVVVSSLTNVAGPRISTRPVEGLPLMHVEMPSFAGGHHVIKRAMDIVLSSIALIILAPLFGLLMLLVRRDSEGPAFFSQDRVGQNGRTFRMYKFRSMVLNAEAELARLTELNEGNGLLFKMRDDPRVTRIGHVLRKYSLDELPQIFNVLRGDMSLVGPRPPLPSEVEAYEGHTGRRLFIKPGLTGLWQINGRSDLDWEESVRLDLYYVENWSVTGDLMIMWRTVKVMLQPEGAY